MKTLLITLLFCALTGEALLEAARRDRREYEAPMQLSEKRIKSLEGLRDDQKFELLNKLLTKDYSDAEKAFMHYELSKLHSGIDDYREALDELKKAIRLADRHQQEIFDEYKRVNLIVNPPQPFPKILQGQLRKRQLSLMTTFAYEFDSNVVLEEVSPTQPTNKDDHGFSSFVMLTRSWNKPTRKWQHRSSLGLYNLTYFDFHELDFLNYSLVHEVSRNKKIGKDSLSLSGRGTFNLVLIGNDRMLHNWELGTSAYYDHRKWRTLFGSYLSYRESSYFDNARSGQDGNTVTLQLSAKHTFRHKMRPSLSATLQYLDENPDSEILQFDQLGMDLQYRHKLKGLPVLDAIGPRLGYSDRSYRSAVLNTDKREDKQTRLGIDLEKKHRKFHNFKLSYDWTNNRSNQSINHYKKYKISFSYSLFL